MTLGFTQPLPCVSETLDRWIVGKVIRGLRAALLDAGLFNTCSHAKWDALFMACTAKEAWRGLPRTPLPTRSMVWLVK